MDYIKNFNIEGLVEIKPRIFKDDRGQFIETYNEQKLKEVGFDYKFVQDNESVSKRGVFRGIHLQAAPYAQGKLVRVIKGSAVDFAIDLRPGSKTFGHWASVLLKSEWANQFYIPEGFGHAFLALEDDTVFAYKCTNVYHKDSEISVKWDDPDLNLMTSNHIKDMIDHILVSEKDNEGISLEEYKQKYCK